MDFAQLEDIDGVRLTWNIWPNSKLEATKCVIPFAAVYTPNKQIPTMPVREPVCSNQHGVGGGSRAGCLPGSYQAQGLWPLGCIPPTYA